jgi:hypothetical protein
LDAQRTLTSLYGAERIEGHWIVLAIGEGCGVCPDCGKQLAPQSRAGLVTRITCGLPFGGAICGIVAANLDWQAIFYVGVSMLFGIGGAVGVLILADLLDRRGGPLRLLCWEQCHSLQGFLRAASASVISCRAISARVVLFSLAILSITAITCLGMRNVRLGS